ncbi:MAG: hypothetical protein ABJN18_04735, partial [Marinobacter sp.]|uniref:hypothetical protein n=1 Tax=Marinobacter sp. TaxID=50741 RepID=UPI0032969C76
MLDVTSLDGSYCFDAAQGRLGRSERPEALAVAEEALHGSVVALDQIVSPLPIDVPNAVEMRVIPVVDLADDAPVRAGFVGANCYWPMEPHAL